VVGQSVSMTREKYVRAFSVVAGMIARNGFEFFSLDGTEPSLLATRSHKQSCLSSEGRVTGFDSRQFHQQVSTEYYRTTRNS
jgi:hypothetical protein